MDAYESMLTAVRHPGRYLGREVNACHKEPGGLAGRMVLAYPDLYELGMSYLGLQVLYRLVNDQPDLWAERVFAPAVDMERLLRERQEALRSLESRTPLCDFDVVGFTLQHELTYPDVLVMLDLGRIPLAAADRGEQHPLVIAGGPGAANPEPLAEALDAVYLGDGEVALVDLLRRVGQARRAGVARSEILCDLARLPGIYVPSLYRVTYRPDGRLDEIRALAGAPDPVPRAVAPDLDAIPPPDRPLVPAVQAIHDRLAVEIQRGCTRGCRFCQAGMINRPLRQRDQAAILRSVDASLAESGHDQVSFLSLSSGDHPQILNMLEAFFARYAGRCISASLPSLRAETLTPDLAELVRTVRKSGFTIAPEAGSERMRRVINKDLTEADVLNAANRAFAAGWQLLKLYFMIGLPGEDQSDRQAIAALCERVSKSLSASGANPKIHVGISTFVPKAHTPFQWEAMIGPEESLTINRDLRQELRRVRGIKVSWTRSELSWAEGLLSRGDRRQFSALCALARSGARLAGWNEHFRIEDWQEAFGALDVPGGPDFYLRERAEDEVLPWRHLDLGPSADFLLAERHRAKQEQITADCVGGTCTDCGACEEGQAPVLAHAPPPHPPTAPAEIAPAGEPAVRVRLGFTKRGPAALMSHIEFMHATFRALRRARWPLVHTAGFHPKPKASFGPACPLGAESLAEFADLHLSAPVGEADQQRLAETLPDGLSLIACDQLAESAPGIMKGLAAIHYRFDLADDCDLEALRAACDGLLARTSWWVQRTVKGRRKRVDLRPSIAGLEVAARADDALGPVLRLHLTTTASPLARPSEVQAEVIGCQVGGLVRDRLVFHAPTEAPSAAAAGGEA